MARRFHSAEQIFRTYIRGYNPTIVEWDFEKRDYVERKLYPETSKLDKALENFKRRLEKFFV